MHNLTWCQPWSIMVIMIEGLYIHCELETPWTGKDVWAPLFSLLHHDPDLDKQQKMTTENDRWVAVILQVYKGSNGSLFTCGLILTWTTWLSADNDQYIGGLLWEAATLLILYQRLTAYRERCQLSVVTKHSHLMLLMSCCLSTQISDPVAFTVRSGIDQVQ